MSDAPDRGLDVQLARVVGPDAKPGRVRMARDDDGARLQQQWVGSFGAIWIDVPEVVVNALHPKMLPVTDARTENK